MAAEQHVWTLPYIKVEIFLQLIYDGHIFTGSERSTYTSRLRGLFWIAVPNFVFPVILNFTLIVFLFRDPNPQRGTDVMVVNICVDIIGVVLATVWCSGTHWQSGTQAPVPEEKTIQFRSTATFVLPDAHESSAEPDVELSEVMKEEPSGSQYSASSSRSSSTPSSSCSSSATQIQCTQ